MTAAASARAARAGCSWTGHRSRRAGFAQTVRFRFSLDETFDVGEDTGTPVVEDYAMPFAFGGTLENVNITLR